MGRRLVYVTAPGMDEAQALARMAVERRLAACANILPGMRSLYWWQGRMESAEEVVLLLKTTEALEEVLIQAERSGEDLARLVEALAGELARTG